MRARLCAVTLALVAGGGCGKLLGIPSDIVILDAGPDAQVDAVPPKPDAGCIPGESCTPETNPCMQGERACGEGGASSCDPSATAQPDHTRCGGPDERKECQGGQCVACVAGDECDSANRCMVAHRICGECVDVGPRDDLTPCGDGMFCLDGVCNVCEEGGPCSLGVDQCYGGTWSCMTGTPVCVQNADPVADDTVCGLGSRCIGGVCMCFAGDPCTPDDACHDGVVSCETSASCQATATWADGKPCGTDHVCHLGACESCMAGGACDPGALCHAGITECATGVARCSDIGPAAEGTFCGDGGACQGGACVPCADGSACTPDVPCRQGTLSCTGGAASCMPAGNAPDGSPCGDAMVCSGGACAAPSFKLAIKDGDGQMGYPGQQLDVVKLRLTDAAGNGVSAQTVTFAALTGGGVNPASAKTNMAGYANLTPRLAMRLGPYTFAAMTPSALPVEIVASAKAPPAGSIFPVANADYAPGFDPVSGPAISARLGYPSGLAIAHDGTIYVADESRRRISRITPSGEIADIAGRGDYSSDGDFGSALLASLSQPGALALDETVPDDPLLFVADRAANRVRVITLSDGTIWPFMGDGSSSAGSLIGPSDVSIGPDGLVYVVDDGHDRIVSADKIDGFPTTWLAGAGGYCAGERIRLVTLDDRSQLLWDPFGTAFVSGTYCGTDVASDYGTPAVARIEADGTLVHVAGRNGGSDGDGAPATQVRLYQCRMALDPAGNLFLSEAGANKIRRITGATGLITTVAGEGSAGHAGDFGDPTMSTLSTPLGLAFDASGDLLFADSGNSAVRAIWHAGATEHEVAMLTLVSGESQKIDIDRAAPELLEVSIADAKGESLGGFPVEWHARDVGGAVSSTRSTSSAYGMAAVTGYPGLVPDKVYRFDASFKDVHGRDAVGSPALFEIAATAPETGVLFSVVNAPHTPDRALAGPAVVAHAGESAAGVGAPDGSVYFADSYYDPTIRKLTPDGMLVHVAGNHGWSDTGDSAAAVDAGLTQIRALALGDGTLYLLTAGRLVRAIDLASGIITTVAGGGPAEAPGYGDDGPATAAAFADPYGLAAGPDGSVYVVDYPSTPRIRKINAATHKIEAWFTPGDCSASVSIYAFSWPYNNNIAVDDDGRVYVAGTLCGTSFDGGYPQGIVRRETSGSFTHIAGASVPVPDTDDAKLAVLYAPRALVLDAGELYFLDANGYIVQRIDTSGHLHTVAGTWGSPATGGNYVPATSTTLDYPSGIARAGGHLFIGEQGTSYSLRVVW